MGFLIFLSLNFFIYFSEFDYLVIPDIKEFYLCTCLHKGMLNTLERTSVGCLVVGYFPTFCRSKPIQPLRVFS